MAKYDKANTKMTTQTKVGMEHAASARSLNLPISTKHSVEISRYLRYKNTQFAKQFLEKVISLQKPVPFKKFTTDLGHKPGIGPGRYPQKAAREFLKLVKSVEANAQANGLDTSALKITTLIANKASIPLTGGRHQHAKKRTHLEIVVAEGKQKQKETKSAKKQAVLKDVKNERLPAKELVQGAEKTFEGKNEGIAGQKLGGKEVPRSAARGVSPQAETRQAQKPQELSSEDLLERVQTKAAEFNKREKEKKNTEDVSKLYDQLKQKGTLRGEQQ